MLPMVIEGLRDELPNISRDADMKGFTSHLHLRIKLAVFHKKYERLRKKLNNHRRGTKDLRGTKQHGLFI